MTKALLTTSSNQSTLSFFASKAGPKGKTGVYLLPCRERQITRLKKLVVNILGELFPW